MGTTRGWRRAALAGLIAAVGTPASAQDVRPESLRMYGGTYSTDCKNPAAPKLRIAADALVVEHGARRKVGRGVMDSFVSFGAAPTSPIPAGYVMEFISDAFSFYVFQDKAGYYIEPGDSVPGAEALIGKANLKARFRRCSATARPAPSA